MPRPGLIAARNHWCLHNDQLAQEFDGILNLTQTFPGCAKAPNGAIFFAPLSSNLTEVVAGLIANFVRSLEALYQSPSGQWMIAADGVPRFEQNQLLMEPAGTNKCACYSFPDAALTGYIKTAEGVMTRQLGQPSEFNTIGNGYCVRLDTTGTASARIDVDGDVGNLNPHIYSAYARKLSGSNVARIQSLTNPAGVEITSANWERLIFLRIPTGTGERLSLFCDADVIAEIMFPQLEEAGTVSSPIITRGASASRGADLLNYSNINSVFNQGQGMVSVDWTPKHARDINALGNINHAVLNVGTGRLAYFNFANNSQMVYEGTNASLAFVTAFSPGEVFRVVTTYGPAGTGPDRLSAGYHRDGAWTWDSDNNRTYDGAFTSDNLLQVGAQIGAPSLFSRVTLWDVNQGRAWVEANLTP